MSNANAATHIFSIFRKQPAEQEIKFSEFCYTKCLNLHGNGHLFLSVHSFASIVHSHNKKLVLDVNGKKNRYVKQVNEVKWMKMTISVNPICKFNS